MGIERDEKIFNNAALFSLALYCSKIFIWTDERASEIYSNKIFKLV